MVSLVSSIYITALYITVFRGHATCYCRCHHIFHRLCVCFFLLICKYSFFEIKSAEICPIFSFYFISNVAFSAEQRNPSQFPDLSYVRSFFTLHSSILCFQEPPLAIPFSLTISATFPITFTIP